MTLNLVLGPPVAENTTHRSPCYPLDLTLNTIHNLSKTSVTKKTNTSFRPSPHSPLPRPSTKQVKSPEVSNTPSAETMSSTL